MSTKSAWNLYWVESDGLSFLYFFDIYSRVIKTAFRASFHASIEFALLHWGKPDGFPEKWLNEKDEEDMGMFFEFFKPKKETETNSWAI